MPATTPLLAPDIRADGAAGIPGSLLMTFSRRDFSIFVALFVE
jgi:hypothetical protein